MVTQGISRDGSPTKNPWVDTLISESQWSNGGSGPVTITYSFKEGPYRDGSYSCNASPWQDYEKDAYRGALQSWANVANLNFVENASGGGNLQERLDSNLDSYGFLGWHAWPEAGRSYAEGFYDNTEWNAETLVVGGYDFAVMVHELGHALGLRHPHDVQSATDKDIFPGLKDGQSYKLGSYNLNQSIFTVMSYNDGWRTQFPQHTDESYGWVAGPMAFDIAAIQKLYGANNSYKTGNDSYALPTGNGAGTYWSCIWDAGGADTISAAGANTSATIDLRAAPLMGPNAGGYVSWISGIVGGYTIANGAWIENATGGNANDRLNGNEIANILNGGAGADIMTGFDGDDTYVVDNARDSVIEGSRKGTDTVEASISYKLTNNVEKLTLTGSTDINGTGNALRNTITGNDGNNILDGGAGADTLAGGRGDDTYIIDNAGDVIIEGSGGGTDEVRSSVSITLADNVEKLVLAGRAAINGTGNDLANIIIGNNGNNMLDGGTGADRLEGGRGSDTYIVDHVDDVIIEGSNAGIDTIKSSVSLTLSANVENLVLTGTGAINGAGNVLANAITGNNAANVLKGLGGNDTLNGGDGDDWLHGGAGADRLTGGNGADHFVFDTAPGSGFDTITDFAITSDKIVLSKAMFGALGDVFEAAELFIGAAAKSLDQHIIYNSRTGGLYYDADGSGVGKAVQFALLANKAALAFTDFEFNDLAII